MYNIALGIIIGLIFISLIVLFCILLVKLYIKKIREHNQKELSFQKTLNETIIETQEHVLNNISKDLHDDAGQQLTVINFQLEHLKLDSPEWNAALSPLSESVGKLSQSIRSISHALNNQLVVQQDLLKAISAEVERLQKNTKVTIVFSLESKPKTEFSSNEKIIIYRIFQECINNSLKHAKATEISVSVQTTPKFQMAIGDNGVGFEIKNQSKKSLGLISMDTRAASINYQLTIVSALGKGTTITLTDNKNS
ncbi:sensor histidine kinase [Flavobacterium sp.]